MGTEIKNPNIDKSVKRDLEYQTKAAEEIISYLEEEGKDVTNFQAPTGSGKTAILGQTIEKYLDSQKAKGYETTVVFISPPTGRIDLQNYEKIKGQLKNNWVKGFKTKYIGPQGGNTGNYLQGVDSFEFKKVYFLGWGILTGGGKISSDISEQRTIFDVIEKTHDEGTNILLVIDEAHIGVKKMKSETKIDIMKKLNPHKTINLSATMDQEVDVTVTIADVRNEAAIKKSVIVSSGDEYDGEIKDLDDYSDIQELINVANEKQKQITKAYKKEGIKQNPATLIQIPNITNIESNYQEEVETHLQSLGYIKDVDYAVYLSGKKSVTKSELIEKESPFKFIIFKQAIATGWDIPRANILVRLREPKSSAFDIQTLGRIMRNSFFKYYDNGLIDNGFVFTKDSTYKSKIEKESYVTSDINYKEYQLSEKGKKCKVKLNNLKYNTDIKNQEELAEIVFKNHGKKLIQYVLYSYNRNSSHYIKRYNNNTSLKSEVDTISLDDKMGTAKTLKNQSSVGRDSTNTAESFSFVMTKLKTLLKGNRYLIDLTKEILTGLTGKVDVRELLKFLVSGFSDPLFAKNNLNYLSLLNKSRDAFIKKNYNMEKSTFKLNKTFKYPEPFAGDGKTFDGISTYNIEGNHKKLDSKNEEIFFDGFEAIQEFMSKDIEKHHLFRNGISDESFYIEYVNSTNSISRFYPDFISFDDKNKIVNIMEVKGVPSSDIDRSTKEKFKTLRKNINNICDDPNYTVKVTKVMVNDRDQVLFEDRTKTIVGWKALVAENNSKNQVKKKEQNKTR